MVVDFVLFTFSTAANVFVERVDSFNQLFSISSLRPPLGGGDEKNVNKQPEQPRIEMEVPLWFTHGRLPRVIQGVRQVRPAIRQVKPSIPDKGLASGQSLVLRRH